VPVCYQLHVPIGMPLSSGADAGTYAAVNDQTAGHNANNHWIVMLAGARCGGTHDECF